VKCRTLQMHVRQMLGLQDLEKRSYSRCHERRFPFNDKFKPCSFGTESGKANDVYNRMDGLFLMLENLQ
jgi:hypothetical protein